MMRPSDSIAALVVTSAVLVTQAHAESEVTKRAFNDIKIEAGQTLFDINCRRCHAADSSDPSYGPELAGIVGRPAGSVAGFDYSDALAKSGIVWTRGALRAWLEDNDGFMPGTRMRHVGIEDETVQDFILTFLESLTE